jgi:antitoxin component YwqK of YwqJK toxin-antitoxin module
MKKIFLIITLFSCSFAFLSAQNAIDKQGRKQGEWSKTYANGKTAYKGSFIDDKPVGTFLRYYESGELKAEQNYLDNDISEIKLYNKEKKLISAGRYKGKLKDGEWKYYSGNQLSSIEIYKDGKREGITKIYSKNGNLLEEIPYKNDKIDGIKKNFLENGKLYSEISYKDGVQHGSYFFYEGNPDPVISGNYVNGKKEGDWQIKDERGKLLQTLKYENGVLTNVSELTKAYDNALDEHENNKGRFQEPDAFQNDSY